MAAATLVLAAGLAFAQDAADATAAAPKTPSLAEQVTVTASRGQERIADTPASVAVLTGEALQATAAPTLDDALRQVVGFSLFRRTGSRYANPTAQGVSLRGLGASGASRALVLVDGLPENDPFGGWVYWGRVPRLGVERLEVLRGGASDLYGTSALGGVVQVLSRRATDRPGLDAELSGGGLGTVDGSLSAAGERDGWGARFSGEAFRTDGYVPVEPASRGPVDTAVASRYVSGALRLQRQWAGGGRVFLEADGYGEDRENGTPLQTNDTRLGMGALGADWGGRDGTDWSARFWGESQLFHQSFSSVSDDRTREDLVRQQRVPASALGLSLQRSFGLGARQHLLAGVEAGRVEGTTEETVFSRGVTSSRVDAGGNQRTAAAFVQDLWQAHPRLLLAVSVRADGWWLADGHTTTTLLASGTTSTLAAPDRQETAVSPRLAALFRAGRGVSLLASGYGAFRAPTLNELYRSFRLGNTLTLANAGLKAERLRGGEAGVLVTRGPVALRVTGFQAQVHDAVANVTVSSTASLITRQRQNVGRLRSRGLESEAELRLPGHATLSAGYALTDSRVVSF
ncbi:MAG TPA: TonB-dependent receptor, partial [Vicinamibacteria bacterium]|nr:TonB-dependent receptor [Vicinamibacteria bacterium]